jgi:hypothetical protein
LCLVLGRIDHFAYWIFETYNGLLTLAKGKVVPEKDVIRDDWSPLEVEALIDGRNISLEAVESIFSSLGYEITSQS